MSSAAEPKSSVCSADVASRTLHASRTLQVMLEWDVNNGVARRSWAGNDNAQLTIKEEMARLPGLNVTLPVRADHDKVRAAISTVSPLTSEAAADPMTA